MSLVDDIVFAFLIGVLSLIILAAAVIYIGVVGYFFYHLAAVAWEEFTEWAGW